MAKNQPRNTSARITSRLRGLRQNNITVQQPTSAKKIVVGGRRFARVM